MPRQFKAILLSLLLFIASTPLFATQTTYTFYPISDTFIKGNAKNENEGLATNLRIQHPPHYGHVLLKFSQSDLVNTLGTNHVVSATLKLYIETNFNNWGSSGTIVDVHRLNADWEERITTNPAQGVTWTCYPLDTNLGNGVPNCDEEWDGGFYEDYVTASSLHQNNQTGWKNYNVTSDVQLFQNGIDHYGWLIRKRDSTANGSVDYTSIQGTAAFKPRLEVTVDDASSCNPAIIDTITPAVIISDGTDQSITVSGEGLDRITEVLIDGTNISFTLVNSTTLTFVRNYSAPGLHTLMLRSNCLQSPIELYEFEAAFEFAGYGVDIAECTDCSMPGAATYFSRNGDRLCFNRCFSRLIGYGGDFTQITWNFKWNSDSDGDGVNDDSTIIENYMKRSQFKSGTTANSRGFNLNRQFAIGGGCNNTAGPVDCKGYKEDNENNPPLFPPSPPQAELMPFKVLNNKYDILNLKSDGSNLNHNWKKRIKNYIKYADKNGIAVTISLFDENTMSGAGPWPKNPWNKNNNNLGCSQIPGGSSAFPNFYKIFNTNGTLNCLGLEQKNYVQSVVSAVKNNKKCGNTGAKRCKNVIFEIMNEAVFDEGWNSSDLTLDQFKAWHETVASWIKSIGAFMVIANVKEAPGEPWPCETQNDVKNFCKLQACGSTNCPNYFRALFASKVDIISIHWGTWEGDVCGTDDEALELGKPVIFDDDGGSFTDPHPRNSNTNVRNWSLRVSQNSGCPGGAKNKGEVHFYHTGDGSKHESSAPTFCFYNDVRYVDCEAWNGIADGIPDLYCGAGLTPCAARVDYCENHSTDCIFP